MLVSAALMIENKDGVRCQTGDIVAVRPVGWQWGTEELKRFLIVVVDLGEDISTIDQAREILMEPIEEDVV